MKKLFLLIVVSFLLSGNGYAQITSFPWTEGFEGGTIPSGWTQSFVLGTEPWDVDNWFPHNGTYSAYFYGWWGDVTKLVTPKLNLSGLTNPVLKFWHFEPWYYGQDTLKVYYKNSSSGAWNLLGTYSTGTINWTEETIALPNASNDYYIAFEGISGGTETDLDDVTVFDFVNYVDVEVASVIAPTTGINLSNAEQVKVLLKNNGSDSLTNFSLELKLNGTTIATETFTDTIPSLGQYQYTFTNTVDLSVQGSYTIIVTAIAANDQDTTNDSKTINVYNTVCSVISSFPWTEGFEGGIFPPNCWITYDIDGYNSWGDGEWTENYNSHSGTASAGHIYYCGVNQEGWLITPQLAIPNTGTYVLDFWSKNDYPFDYDYNGVLVSTTGYDPTISAFTQIKQLSGSEVSNSWKKITIPLNAYAGQNINIGFKYTGDCADSWFIDDIMIYDVSNYIDAEVLSITAPTSGVNLSNAEQVKVLLKNNGSDLLTNFSLELKLNGTTIATETFTDTIPSMGQYLYTFTNTVDLSAQGNHTIKVTAIAANDQNSANDSKQISIFNTICSQITSFPWLADFTYGLSSCWTNTNVGGSGGTWYVYGTTAYSYSYSSTRDNWLITPPIVLDTNYSLMFDVSNDYIYNYGETYSILISTTGTNISDFTAIHTETLTTSYSTKSVILPLNAYKGQSIYIAFRHWGNGDDELYIRDIKILDLSNYVDVEVASITSPSSGNLTNNEQVTVLLKNNGGTALTGFSLELELDWTLVATETFTDTIPSFGQAQYTFAKTVNLSAEGSHTIAVTAVAANDQNPTNDFQQITVYNYTCNPITSFPWAANFSSGISPCWTNIDADGDWNYWSPAGGTSLASYSYSNNVDNWLITPQLVLDADYSLMFEASTQYFDYYGEKYSVLISTTGTNISDFTAIYTETLTSSYSTKSVILPLNVYNGQSIYIAFRHWGNNDHSLHISNIKIFDPNYKPEPVKLYAYRILDDEMNAARLGFVSFESSTPQTITQLNNFAAGYSIIWMTGEYINGDFYYYFLKRDDYGNYTADFVKISPTTLVREFTKTTTEFPYDMAYDFSTNTMYGVAQSDWYGSILVTINLQTGAMTPIDYIGEEIRMLACNESGQLYGIDEYGNFYSIDKTNATTAYINNTGFSPSYYRFQTMSFDHNTGRLFWAMCEDYTEERKLIEINSVSGFAYDCGNFYDNAWIVGMYTKPYDIVSLTPANLATDVELNAQVAVKFTRNITANNLSGITISPNVSGVSASISGNILTIAHDNFKGETAYTVTIPAGTINEYSEAISWKFKTKKEVNIPLYSENNIKIYPNPTTGKLQVTSNELRENVIIEIFDVVGKLQKAESRKQNGEITIDISHLANGMYFLKIDEKVFKIIKN